MAKKKVVSNIKSKTSRVKQRNRLRNKGKLKTKKKHPSKTVLSQLHRKSTSAPVIENNITDDIIDMVEDDDIQFLKNSIKEQKYNLLKQIRINNFPTRKKKKEDDHFLEDEYSNLNYSNDYNVKMLLPIKTKEGIQRQFTTIKDEQSEKSDNYNKTENVEVENVDSDHGDVYWLEKTSDTCEINLNEPISMAKIYAKRDETIRKYKIKIGFLSSSLIENPELKINHLSVLLEIMGRREPEMQLTIKKFVTLSLLEVFKDLIPTYQIKHQDAPKNKLKKITRQLLSYENQLLKGYKDYLLKLEKLADYLRKKKGDTRIITKQQKNLGFIAVKCFCELLTTHSYFNFAENIVHLLTLFLDNPDEKVRKLVEDCYKNIFKEDKKGLISLIIVRRINYLVKSRSHSVHCEALSVLLSLRIKHVNLDQEKEDEIKHKKLIAKRHKLLSVTSKKERKRKKELQKLEKEMLEAKAEENKKSKEHHMTEITKVVFLIYFRILKRAPRSNLLSITLEGLTKFAPCINLEYYQDIVNLLNSLLENETLNIKEQLYCIKTVFIIVSKQTDILNIDPSRFFTHLYKIMLNVHAGKTHECTSILLSTLEEILVNRRKTITTQRMLSFTKRLATLTLQLLHNGSLGALSIIKSITQLTKTADLLLDIDCNYGQGIYDPELNEPEFCNAGNTALWELCALRRHYHPVVRKMAIYVNRSESSLDENLHAIDFKKSSVDFCKEYEFFNEDNDATRSFTFKPAVPPPTKKFNNNLKYADIKNSELIQNCYRILKDVSTELSI